jgi:hypothetical protein
MTNMRAIRRYPSEQPRAGGSMRLTEMFRGETFRSIIVIVIPGLATLTPYVMLLVRHHESLESFATTEALLAVLMLLLASLTVGFIIEALGGWAEVLLDKQMVKRFPEHLNEWRHYLTLAYKSDAEPIGQSYLREVLLHLKFELSLGIAAVLALGGSIPLGIQSNVGCPWMVLVVGGQLALAAYLLFYEAPASAKILHDTRHDLLEAYGSYKGFDK